LEEISEALNSREIEDAHKNNYIDGIEKQLKETLSRSKNLD